MKKRRSLTPPDALAGASAGGLHATRRGGARREVSARVTLKGKSGEVLEGWALNVSRGGVRVILEQNVELGAEFEVTITPGAADGADKAADKGEGRSAAPTHNAGRIVWVQEEPDGVIAGVEFRTDL